MDSIGRRHKRDDSRPGSIPEKLQKERLLQDAGASAGDFTRTRNEKEETHGFPAAPRRLEGGGEVRRAQNSSDNALRQMTAIFTVMIILRWAPKTEYNRSILK